MIPGRMMAILWEVKFCDKIPWFLLLYYEWEMKIDEDPPVNNGEEGPSKWFQVLVW